MIRLEQSQDVSASSNRPMPSLSVRLTEARDYDRQRALRTLLQQPLSSRWSLCRRVRDGASARGMAA